MDYPHKNDQIKRARGLCRKTSFLHFSNSSFVPSCEWIYFFKINFKTSEKSLNRVINHYFIFKELMTIPFHHLTGQNIGWRELGSTDCKIAWKCVDTDRDLSARWVYLNSKTAESTHKVVN